MIVFVDYEHADGYQTEYGQRMQAARTWITYRLEDLANTHCMLVRYDRLSWELLDRLGAQALFISGNSIDPDQYDPHLVAPLLDIVANSGLPVFGFCGGFQVMALAFGVDVVPLDFPPEVVEGDDRLVSLSSGRPFEFGYHPVTSVGEHRLFDGLVPRPVYRHAHGLHVPLVPEGFEVVATNDLTPVQMAVDDRRQMVGTQFHPEYWTGEHPDGRTLIANFCRWVGIAD